jgi:hypothetical protein
MSHSLRGGGGIQGPRAGHTTHQQCLAHLNVLPCPPQLVCPVNACRQLLVGLAGLPPCLLDGLLVRGALHSQRSDRRPQGTRQRRARHAIQAHGECELHTMAGTPQASHARACHGQLLPKQASETVPPPPVPPPPESHTLKVY